MMPNLFELIEALKTTEEELSYQTARLSEGVVARTQQEAEYLATLRDGYIQASDPIKKLRRYHEKRLERLQNTGTTKPGLTDHEESITDGGVAQFSLADPEE